MITTATLLPASAPLGRRTPVTFETEVMRCSEAWRLYEVFGKKTSAGVKKSAQILKELELSQFAVTLRLTPFWHWFAGVAEGDWNGWG